MSWSEWHRFSELKANPADNCKVGVYQVRITTGDRRPVSVPRACCPDAEGILYIGCGYLPDRVGRLLRIFERDPKHHHNFIWVYLTYGLERIGDRKLLEVRWMECEEFKYEEQRLMEEYKLRTGDIPPGNLKKERQPPPTPETDVEET